MQSSSTHLTSLLSQYPDLEDDLCTQARKMLYAQNNFKWALHEDQIRTQEAINRTHLNNHRIFVLMCGRRWGKTRLLVTDAFRKALSGPNKRILYAALTWTSVRNFVIPEAMWLQQYAPEHMKPTIVAGEIKFPNGSVIILRGAEDELKAERLRGAKADWIYVDEAGFINVLPYLIKSVLLPQVLTTGGGITIASSPPKSAAHPFVDFVIQAEIDGTLVRRKTSDAPHISPEDLELYCKEMGGSDSVDWKREAECLILTDHDSAVIPEFQACQEQITIHEDPIIPDYANFYMAADLGYKDMTVILLAYYDFERAKIVVLDERSLKKSTSAEIQAAAYEMEQKWIPKLPQFASQPYSRVVDAPLITIADLVRLQKDNHIKINGKWANPEADIHPDSYWRLTQKDDKEAAINSLRLAITRNQLEIHSRCKVLLSHCLNATWNKLRTQFERPQGSPHHFDGLDALIYLNRSIDRNLSPYPPPVPVGKFTRHGIKNNNSRVNYGTRARKM